jgi:hypothetical protein
VHLVSLENHFNNNAPATICMLDNNSLMVPKVSSWQSESDMEKKVHSHPEGRGGQEDKGGVRGMEVRARVRRGGG